jgi:hypothetical protein
MDQYAIADVGFASPGVNLLGKTLHAWVRLASGSFAGGVVFYACRAGTPSWICTGTPLTGADKLTVGAWVPLTLDLATGTTVGFDAEGIREIGVTFLSSAPSPDGGIPDDGGTFVSTGNTVFQIDTVTDRP